MAFLEIDVNSNALKRNVIVNVILPEKRKQDGIGSPGELYKTLYLFHGLSGNCKSWMHKTSIARYASQYGIAVVMPEVGRSWYTDTAWGENNFTFVTEELPEICRSYFKGMSPEREYNYVGGLSMGGYGAIKAALSCPESYCGCISLSGALDITRRNRPYDIMEWRAIFGFETESALQLEGSRHDIFALAQRNSDEGICFPKMYLWCGTEDSLIHTNRDFDSLLTKLGAEHRYEESEGDHSWKWWDLHIQDGLEFIFENK